MALRPTYQFLLNSKFFKLISIIFLETNAQKHTLGVHNRTGVQSPRAREYRQRGGGEAFSNVYSAGPISVGTRPVTYIPSPRNGLNCRLTQTTNVGSSSLGQLRQGVRSRSRPQLGQRPQQRATLILSGYPQDWGPCGQLYTHLKSGTIRWNYILVNDKAFLRDSDQ